MKDVGESGYNRIAVPRLCECEIENQEVHIVDKINVVIMIIMVTIMLVEVC